MCALSAIIYDAERESQDRRQTRRSCHLSCTRGQGGGAWIDASSRSARLVRAIACVSERLADLPSWTVVVRVQPGSRRAQRGGGGGARGQGGSWIWLVALGLQCRVRQRRLLRCAISRSQWGWVASSLSGRCGRCVLLDGNCSYSVTVEPASPLGSSFTIVLACASAVWPVQGSRDKEGC